VFFDRGISKCVFFDRCGKDACVFGKKRVFQKWEFLTREKDNFPKILFANFI
jgi:hypothetical protein